MPQYNKIYFEKQFEDLHIKAGTNKARAIIALRAAMRVLPLLADRPAGDAGPPPRWKRSERVRNFLAIFQCYQASVYANSLVNAEIDSATAQAAGRSAAAHAAVVLAAARSTGEPIAVAVAYAAARSDPADALAAAYAAAAYADAAYAAARSDAADDLAAAISSDLEFVSVLVNVADLLAKPLWKKGLPAITKLWPQFRSDLRSLDAGFDVWIDWYQDRLEGKRFNWVIERQWALLSEERLAQGPLEINAHLKELSQGALTKQLKRVRAIFIGNGEVGKTSLIRALHGEEEVEGKEPMTPGVAIEDAIHEQAGVFIRVTDYQGDDLTVHFWDFGGQVMAHATHQFFLRSRCLYVIVLASRADRNPNEEAEYWLEHVRAFGDGAPVLLVGWARAPLGGMMNRWRDWRHSFRLNAVYK